MAIPDINARGNKVTVSELLNISRIADENRR